MIYIKGIIFIVCFVGLVVAAYLHNKKRPYPGTNLKAKKLKLGKYYEPSLNYEAIMQNSEDNAALDALQNLWLKSMGELEDEIKSLENKIENESSEKNIQLYKAKLQPLYEKFAVSKEYLPRFNSSNNLPLLNDIYLGGNFCLLKNAEEKRKHYDDLLYFQTNDYKKDVKKIPWITVVVDIVVTFFFCVMLGVIAQTLFGNVEGPFATPTMWENFGLGVVIVLFGSPITLPLLGAINFYLIPHIINKTVLGERISEKEKRNEQNNAFIGITASAIAGGIIHHHIKKNKKEYK